MPANFLTLADARPADEPHGRAHGGKGTKITRFFGPTGVVDYGSEAYLVEVRPGTQHRAHFHHTDQFQVFFGAPDTIFMNKAVGPLMVHYTDADTVYGPFGAGDQPYKYVTFRRHPSTFTGFLPENRGDLSQGRKKRHAKADLREWLAAGLPPAGEVVTGSPFDPAADHLALVTISAGAGATIEMPSAAGSGGQYLLVVAGGVVRDGDPLPPLSIGWVGAGEPAPVLTAGPDGARVMVLQFGREHVES